MPSGDAVYRAYSSSSGLADPTAATTFKDAKDSTKAAQVLIPGSSRLNGRRFRVNASGRMTGGTTTNFTPIIQYGVSATAASNTDVAAATARACNSDSGVWWIVAEFIWDSTEGDLHGSFRALNGAAGTLDTEAATTEVTGLSAATEGLGFCVTALFSATNASNVAYLDDLALEVL